MTSKHLTTFFELDQSTLVWHLNNKIPRTYFDLLGDDLLWYINTHYFDDVCRENLDKTYIPVSEQEMCDMQKSEEETRNDRDWWEQYELETGENDSDDFELQDDEEEYRDYDISYDY